MFTFSQMGILGAIIINIVMAIIVLANKKEGYKKVMLGFILISFSGIMLIIRDMFKLWPLSVIHLILTTIGVILIVSGLVLILKNYKNKK